MPSTGVVLADHRTDQRIAGNEGSGRVQAIFNNANTALRQPRNLAKSVTVE